MKSPPQQLPGSTTSRAPSSKSSSSTPINQVAPAFSPNRPVTQVAGRFGVCGKFPVLSILTYTQPSPAFDSARQAWPRGTCDSTAFQRHRF